MKLYGKVLEQVKAVRFLGVLFDEKLSIAYDVNITFVTLYCISQVRKPLLLCMSLCGMQDYRIVGSIMSPDFTVLGG